MIIHIDESCSISRRGASGFAFSATNYVHWKKQTKKGTLKSFDLIFESPAQRDEFFEALHAMLVENLKPYSLSNQKLLNYDLFSSNTDFWNTVHVHEASRVYKVPLLDKEFCRQFCDEIQQYSSYYKRELVFLSISHFLIGLRWI